MTRWVSSFSHRTMLALRASHRGVRLHTFEPEDRAYTSTPTKIGGHCLDHVVGVTLTWRRSLNELGKSVNVRRRTSGVASEDRRCSEEDHATGTAADGPAECCTTLEPSLGRFGGLSRVVVRSSPASAAALPRGYPTEPPTRPQPPPATAAFLPPLYPSIVELPPDALARLQYGPDWPPAETCNMSGGGGSGGKETAAMAPYDGGRTRSPPSLTARAPYAVAGGDGVLAPYRNAATGHSGALMAILLSKLANSGDGGCRASDAAADHFDADGGGVLDAAAATATPAEGSAAAAAAAGLSRTELLHRSVDDTAQGLESGSLSGPAVANGTVGGGGRGGIWAWKARVDQTPRYSKLRRYDFVRELGSGSHGTVLLVRKRSAVGASNASSAIEVNSGRSGSGGAGVLRVLKESEFLPEAVNEARLLLLAGGSSDGDGVAGAGVSGTVTASWRDGGYQRGEVVQLHDFFVETLGHRSFAFLELEYCEGGDLRGLILGGRPGELTTPAATPASPSSLSSQISSSPSAAEGGEVLAYRGKMFSASPGEGDANLGGMAGGGGGGGGVQSWGSRGSGVAGSAATKAGQLLGLPAGDIGRVALGLCESLEHLHKRGVLHRDLKPANVLLTKSGAVRVADLGVSTCLDPSRPLTETAAGTVPFMAPEVRKFLLGSRVSYSGKADVWAVGALIYAMAVGDPAPAELATQTRAQLVSVVGHQTGSKALASVAHRALDPDPSRRPSAPQMTSMLRDWCKREGWLARSSHQSRPAAPLARL